MTGPQFHETRRGQLFFERDLPELIKQLRRIADAISILGTRAPTPPDPSKPGSPEKGDQSVPEGKR